MLAVPIAAPSASIAQQVLRGWASYSAAGKRLMYEQALIMRPSSKASVVVQRRSDTWASVDDSSVRTIETLKAPVSEGCPRCGAREIRMMEARVQNEYLASGKGVATYASCAAPGCGWESEMLARAD